MFSTPALQCIDCSSVFEHGNIEMRPSWSRGFVVNWDQGRSWTKSETSPATHPKSKFLAAIVQPPNCLRFYKEVVRFPSFLKPVMQRMGLAWPTKVLELSDLCCCWRNRQGQICSSGNKKFLPNVVLTSRPRANAIFVEISVEDQFSTLKSGLYY